jgi:hypothetical protein
LARESSSRSAEGEQIIDETLNRKAGLVHLAEIGGEALEAIATSGSPHGRRSR